VLLRVCKRISTATTTKVPINDDSFDDLGVHPGKASTRPHMLVAVGARE
jgi:hypothetical protein